MVTPGHEVRNMKRDVSSGILLIVGALAGMLVMSLHPTAHDLLEPGGFARQAHLNAIVHGLALAAVPALFLGLLGLTRRLGWPELGVAAEVIERILSAEAGSRDVHRTLLAYTGIVNQAFAKVHVVATSVALLLWSAAILKTRLMPRIVGHAGAVVGGAVLLAFFGGHLRLNVHGFGIVVALQAVWLIWVGVLLCRSRD